LPHRTGHTTVHIATWEVALTLFVCNLKAAWALSPGEWVSSCLTATKDDRLTSPSQLFAICNCWISFFQRWIILFHAVPFPVYSCVMFVLITCAQYKDMGQSNSDWTATTPVCVKQFRSRSQLLIVLTSLLIQHSTIVWISGLEFTKNTQDTETLRPTKDDRLTSPSQLFAIRNCWISFFQRWIILFHALLFRFTPVLNVCVYYALGAVRTILTCVNQIVTKTVVATSSYHCEGITSTYPHIHTPDCTMTGDTANTWQLLGTDHVIPTREVAAEEGNCDNEER